MKLKAASDTWRNCIEIKLKNMKEGESGRAWRPQGKEAGGVEELPISSVFAVTAVLGNRRLPASAIILPSPMTGTRPSASLAANDHVF